MKVQNKFKRTIKTIPLFFSALRSKETPPAAKALVVLSIAYVVIPTDVIVDFIPVMGLFDDAIVLPFLIYLSTRMIPESLMKKDNL